MRSGPSHAGYCDLFDRKLISGVKHWKSLAVVATVVAAAIAQASGASNEAVARSCRTSIEPRLYERRLQNSHRFAFRGTLQYPIPGCRSSARKILPPGTNQR